MHWGVQASFQFLHLLKTSVLLGDAAKIWGSWEAGHTDSSVSIYLRPRDQNRKIYRCHDSQSSRSIPEQQSWRWHFYSKSPSGMKSNPWYMWSSEKISKAWCQGKDARHLKWQCWFCKVIGTEIRGCWRWRQRWSERVGFVYKAAHRTFWKTSNGLISITVNYFAASLS